MPVGVDYADGGFGHDVHAGLLHCCLRRLDALEDTVLVRDLDELRVDPAKAPPNPALGKRRFHPQHFVVFPEHEVCPRVLLQEGIPAEEYCQPRKGADHVPVNDLDDGMVRVTNNNKRAFVVGVYNRPTYTQ